jgi:hypothetical protein
MIRNSRNGREDRDRHRGGAGEAARGAVAARRPGPAPVAASAVGPAVRRAAAGLRYPTPRLTGFGAGLLATVAMLAFGCLDALLFAGSTTSYGVVFLLVSAACGLWVRPVDLAAAPVGAPIAFAFGLLPINEGTAGLAGQAMGVFTSLSLTAGWLYAGTLLASLIVLARKGALVSRQNQRQQWERQQSRGSRPDQPSRSGLSSRSGLPSRSEQPSRPPRSPRCSTAAQARSRP